MTCYDELLDIYDRYGRSEVDYALKRLMRTRLEKGDRERRKPLTMKQRITMYAHQGGKCARCGENTPPNQMEDDHTVPISKGGTNRAENRRLLCRTCNRSKSDADPFTESKRTGQTITEQLGG